MSWVSLVGKGLFSGAVIVTASEIAKRSATFGAMVVSLPLASIMAMSILYQDTRDTAQVADFAEAIVWLMIPSLVIFLVTPWMLRRDYGFEVSMGTGIVCTIILYAIGAWAAQSIGQVS
jgi:uncharacterized membrane protein (GlpM family)|tara:strand:- start:346 stop:702 length:357 start_codon:yes stop_codon:yes gene_type:complete